MPSRRLLYLAPLAVFAVIAVAAAFYLQSGRDPRLLPSALIDKPAPAFSAPGLEHDGRIVRQGVDSASFEGRITVLNFFASWCTPCLVEHPQITALSKTPGVTLVGINYKDKPAEAANWLARHGNPYARIGVDPAGEIAPEFGLYGVPETFLIDRAGRIRFKQVGPITKQVLEQTILPAIETLKK
ncbi:MAG: DsbE family thiol:disulfide interchange protein [Rhodospirillaceae bacterium]|nr:DsbE family thiol:disulfide interchange protein [Rhodospirillaceae bacterium]MYB14471.1 DsbE family thiol:disulfide interchange protein [Rhodospirillaceae bacterium]MYI49696.1 DsbE family thiol:disulfide interchange protein [Rhodospirillaceae bacterium]